MLLILGVCGTAVAIPTSANAGLAYCNGMQANVGFKNCVIAPASAGYPFYWSMQIKANNGTTSTAYSWAHGGPSGAKGSGDFSWTPVLGVYPQLWVNIDNNYCGCGTSGAYTVNFILNP